MKLGKQEDRKIKRIRPRRRFTVSHRINRLTHGEHQHTTIKAINPDNALDEKNRVRSVISPKIRKMINPQGDNEWTKLM